MLDVAMPSGDPCCNKPLNKALLSGSLAEATEWVCPKCGCLWRARVDGAVRVWGPFEVIEVWR